MSTNNNQGIRVLPANAKHLKPDLKLALRARFEAITSGIEDGQLCIKWPNGAETLHGVPSDVEHHNSTIEFHSYKPIRRLMFGGAVGFAESYLRQEWSTDSLDRFFSLVMRNEGQLFGRTRGKSLARIGRLIRHFGNRNSTRGSQKNISYHYDLGNDFYREWLDDTMSYSAAIFDDSVSSLEDAQRLKMQKITEMLSPSATDKVLEIGCGWGSLAQHISKSTACDIDAISLSEEQLQFARNSYRENSFFSGSSSPKIDFRYQDYRTVKDRYNHIVSVEMFEAVGEEYWPTYFKKVSDLINRGGNVVLQVITISEERFDHYKRQPDFIQRYIFPGGMLPTKNQLFQLIDDAGLELVDKHFFGQGYADTLSRWLDRFEQAADTIKSQGFDDRFMRMWRYYLNYCEVGFRFGSTDVGLLKCVKPH